MELRKTHTWCCCPVPSVRVGFHTRVRLRAPFPNSSGYHNLISPPVSKLCGFATHLVWHGALMKGVWFAYTIRKVGRRHPHISTKSRSCSGRSLMDLLFWFPRLDTVDLNPAFGARCHQLQILVGPTQMTLVLESLRACCDFGTLPGARYMVWNGVQKATNAIHSTSIARYISLYPLLSCYLLLPSSSSSSESGSQSCAIYCPHVSHLSYGTSDLRKLSYLLLCYTTSILLFTVVTGTYFYLFLQ